MADFLISYKKTSINEGGYANDPKDRGGETWEGISRKNFPTWAGWTVIDNLRHGPNFPSSLKNAPGLEDLVQSFYKKNFWDKMKGDQLEFQSVADPIYDSGVNMGVVTAIKLAQDAAFGLPADTIQKDGAIKNLGIIYGFMDAKTLNKLNNKI
jgi:lysozyme family protein